MRFIPRRAYGEAHQIAFNRDSPRSAGKRITSKEVDFNIRAALLECETPFFDSLRAVLPESRSRDCQQLPKHLQHLRAPDGTVCDFPLALHLLSHLWDRPVHGIEDAQVLPNSGWGYTVISLKIVDQIRPDRVGIVSVPLTSQ